MKRRWDEMIGELRSFIQELRRQLAPRDCERPCGLILRCSQQLFWIDRWLDRAEGGICWVKDLELTMENLGGRLKALEEDDWTDQYLWRLEMLLGKMSQFKEG
jgi:hypothetical protein